MSKYTDAEIKQLYEWGDGIYTAIEDDLNAIFSTIKSSKEFDLNYDPYEDDWAKLALGLYKKKLGEY